LSGEGGLVSDSRGDTSEEGRYFGTGLGETENVVNEEKHVLAFFVPEVFGDGESGEADTGTGAWGLVHLTVDKGYLGGLVLQGDDTALNHLVVEIVTLTGPLSDSGEDGVATMSLGNVVDKLHDKYGLADSGTTEQTNLTSLSIGGKEIDNLDTGDEDLLLYAHVLEQRGFGVDGGSEGGINGATLIDGVSDDVDDATEGFGSDGDHDGVSCVEDGLASDKTLGTIHSDGPDGVLSEMLGNFEDELGDMVLHNKGVEDFGESIIELDIHNGTNDGNDLSVGDSGRSIVAVLCNRQSGKDLRGCFSGFLQRVRKLVKPLDFIPGYSCKAELK
jgi:hypothetical protein